MADVRQESPQQQDGRVETSHHPQTDPQRGDKNYYGIPPLVAWDKGVRSESNYHS